VYEVLLERKAERDLKRLPKRFLTDSFHTLKPSQKIPNLQAAVKYQDRKVIGAYGSETIALYMKSARRKTRSR